jgi:hypothetical protein
LFAKQITEDDLLAQWHCVATARLHGCEDLKDSADSLAKTLKGLKFN